MHRFKGRVSVVTGGASGIGHAIASRCVHLGMKVVIADIEERSLSATAKQLEAKGGEILAVVTDVSKSNDVTELARRTTTQFGAVHLLFNNAGVNAGGSIWESTWEDWSWVINVNLWGVIHGIRTFVPIMLEQNTRCHIVNTASISGLIAGPGAGIYKVTKHGIVSLSETLDAELAERHAKIGVSVLCPGWVNTRIVECDRNRPVSLRNEAVDERTRLEAARQRKEHRRSVKLGIRPEDVADCTFRAIRQNQLYVFTHSDSKQWIKLRMEKILHQK